MKQSGQEPHLHLLLEDYSQRAQERQDLSTPRKPQPLHSESLSLRLLIEDYPTRVRDWFARYSPPTQPWDAPETAPDLSLGPLHLLIEEYEPASRRPALKPTRAAGADHNGAVPRVAPADTQDGDTHPAAPKQPREPRRRTEGQRAFRASTVPPEAVQAEPARRAGHAGADEPELDLEVHWEAELGFSSKRKSMATSVAVHAVWIVILLLQPQVLPQPAELLDPFHERQVTLLSPPDAWLRRLTQTEPSKGPVTGEFRGLAETPVPVLAPPERTLPAPPKIAPSPEPVPLPPAETVEAPEPPTPKEAPNMPAQEPDPTPAARSPNPGELRPGSELARARRPNELPAPRSPSRSSEQPKLELETPSATSPGRQGPIELGSLTLNARPGQMIEGAIQELSASGGRGRQAVGDEFGTGGLGGRLPPSPGNTGSNIELLSDAQGVDFRPYLIQVLAAVRRNWYAVIPESARLGFARGRVLIQFAIIPNGTVSKLVIASPSGTQPLDRAAVAGISASNPFPPLPAEYKGSDIRLQFSFRYNMKSK